MSLSVVIDNRTEERERFISFVNSTPTFDGGYHHDRFKRLFINAIKEKLDPADIDMKATDLDRKAADKNIFIQLKRAQDMKGKTDVEFLDKKKQKVDIK